MTASAIYVGRVFHRRLKPREHRLAYRLFLMCLDLDEAPSLSSKGRLFGFNRAAPLAFHERDHGDGGERPLKAQIEERVRAAGLETGGPVRVLCMPRLLGFVFNPITVYLCHDAQGRPSAVVHEVNNTFGDRTAYVLPAGQARPLRAIADKSMHVSPFMDMDCRYAFAMNEPGDRFSLHITVERGGDAWLATGFDGERRPFTDRALLAAWLADPLLTLKVVAGIHWEALKIWLKGVGYRPKPHGRVRFGA